MFAEFINDNLYVGIYMRIFLIENYDCIMFITYCQCFRYEPSLENTNNLAFRPAPTQTSLYSHRSRLEAPRNFGFKIYYRCSENKWYYAVFSKKVQVGKDQEKAQSEKDSHSKNRGGKKPNQQSGTYTMKHI